MFYRGMLAIEDLPLQEQCQAIYNKFSEIRQSVDLATSAIDISRGSIEETNAAIADTVKRMSKLCRRLDVCINQVRLSLSLRA
tara:strand:+ start:482 stop:730 length:249 start_codon:yes stop_codon:yes gene_type:complete